MTSQTKSKVAEMVAKAQEFDRTGNATLRDQILRSIEEMPGVSRKQSATIRKNFRGYAKR